MKKFIRMIKEHPAGIDKGICCKTKDQTAVEFIEGGYAEEITEEEFEKFKKDFYDLKKVEANKSMTDAEERNKKRSETAPTNDEEGNMTRGKKKVYHKLTKADIEINKDYAKGFKPGDEVLLDDKGDLALVAGKLVRKGN